MKKIQLTDSHKEKLFQIPLFRDLPLNIKESLLEKLDFVIYAANKKEIVVTQGTPCNKLFVLLEGKLRTDIIDGLGNEVMIEYIIAPRTFATPHLFNSNNTLPATFTALEDSVILMATKDSTFKVISQDPKFFIIFFVSQVIVTSVLYPVWSLFHAKPYGKGSLSIYTNIRKKTR